MACCIEKFHLGNHLRYLLAVCPNVLNWCCSNASRNAAHGLNARVAPLNTPLHKTVPALTGLDPEGHGLISFLSNFNAGVGYQHDVPVAHVIGKDGVGTPGKNVVLLLGEPCSFGGFVELLGSTTTNQRLWCATNLHGGEGRKRYRFNKAQNCTQACALPKTVFPSKVVVRSILAFEFSSSSSATVATTLTKASPDAGTTTGFVNLTE